MGETIVTVGHVRIEDDGNQTDDYVDLYVDGGDDPLHRSIEKLSNVAPAFSEDAREAIEIAEAWYEYGRSHKNDLLIVAESDLRTVAAPVSKSTVEETDLSEYDYVLLTDEPYDVEEYGSGEMWDTDHKDVETEYEWGYFVKDVSLVER